MNPFKIHFLQTLNVPSVVKSKDNVQTVEYLEDDIQSNIYENVLQQAYSMFKLFHNKFSYVIEENSLSALKTKLQRFYEQVSIWKDEIGAFS